MKIKLKDGTTGVSYQGTPLDIDAQGCVDVEAHVAKELESHGHKPHVPAPKKVRVRVPQVSPQPTAATDGNDGDDGDNHEGDGVDAGDDGENGE